MNIKQFYQYLKYVNAHRWYVMLACFKEGLIWQGLVHDLSKYLPSEFIPYAEFFYDKNGEKKQRRDKSGYYKPEETNDEKFEYAWLYHQNRNRHHWQYWGLSTCDGNIKCYSIPEKYIVEMICDWRGAGRAQGVKRWWDVTDWYKVNIDKMHFSKSTIVKLEYFIGIRKL